MSTESYQIFVVFEGKSYSLDVNDQTSISDFKLELAKKFRLPYIKDLSLFPELKSPTPFYLRYSSRNLDDWRFETFDDFNKHYPSKPIEKEATIQLMISFSSRIWKMIKENKISKKDFILE